MVGVSQLSSTLAELLPKGLGDHPVRFFLFIWPVFGGLGLLLASGEEGSWIVTRLERFGIASSQYILSGCLLILSGLCFAIAFLWVLWLHVSSKTWDGSKD
ncbi:MAG: hypothetical protein CMH91_04920 [Oceanicaulis sp.]|nr:hypothetical protein [Oceanicaulis sp.]MBC38394.1 hypothetical protein [Oceanicaulis sp.]MBG35517.1 hypothetical protein [Oceanicaulis sp.]HBU61239.1 hypothetical protein [Oceanicaulis sp.]HCR95737.1 hypothetical protein [Oceanicaulis sp.]